MYKEQLNENNRKVWRDYGDWVDTNSLEEKRKFRKERDRWDGGLNIHPFSIHIVLTSAWVVKRRIAQYLWTFSFFFWKGSLEDIAVSTSFEQPNIRAENKL